jgi:hypothetical protein
METCKINNEPAFPTKPKQIVVGQQSYNYTDNKGNNQIGYNNLFGEQVLDGMSKRFYAACAAMQGILAGATFNHRINSDSVDVFNHIVVESAYILADELLKQENL